MLLGIPRCLRRGSLFKEKERIQKVYERRYNLKRVKEIYTFFNPASLFTFYQREKKLLNLLKTPIPEGFLWE